MNKVKDLLMLEIATKMNTKKFKEKVTVHAEINHNIEEGSVIMYANTISQTLFFITKLVSALCDKFDVDSMDVYAHLMKLDLVKAEVENERNSRKES